jgi:hypothetical protein
MGYEDVWHELDRRGHFLAGELMELLAEMPTLHLLPHHAQQDWARRKQDIASRIEQLDQERATVPPGQADTF